MSNQKINMQTNKYFIATALLLGVVIFIMSNHSQPHKALNKHQSEILTKAQASVERIRHDFLMTQDPKTHKVETSRLLKARKIQKSRLKSSQYEKSAIPNVTWEERGPNNVSGRTRAILIDKNDATGNTVWAGGVAGGLWKTTNGGSTWTAVDDFFANMAVTTIAQDPNDYDNIYFGTGEGWGNLDAVRGLGIWKSTDGGDNFNQLSSTNNNNHFDFVNKIIVHDLGSSSYVFASTKSRFCDGGGVMRSTNGGTSWTRFQGDNIDCTLTSGATDHSSDIEAAANGDLYTAFGMSGDSDGIYKSTNNGGSWTRVYTSAFNESRIELACAPSNSTRIYALVENTSTGGVPKILKSTNSGSTWPQTSTISWAGDDEFCTSVTADWSRGQDWYDLALAVDPNNANTVYVGTIDLFKSTNGGTSWSTISSWWGGCGQNVHADQHIIVFENSSEIWFGNDGGVYKTNNGTAATPTITFKGTGYNVTQFYAADIHPSAGSNVMLAGAQDNGTQRFTSSAMNTTTEVTGGDGAFCHIDQNNGSTQISSYVFNNYFITEDNWMTYASANDGGANYGRFINPTDYDDVANVLYGSDDPDYYSRVSVSGKTYEYIYVSDFPGNGDTDPLSKYYYGISAVRCSPNVANRVYFGFNNGTVYYVDNAHTGVSGSGKSASVLFNEINLDGYYVSCIEIEEGNENHMLITMSNYGITSIYESTNAMAANPLWLAVEGDLPDMPVRWASFNPTNSDQALIATELGVWSTSNLNASSTMWMPTNTGLANTRIDMIKFRSSDNQMIVASHGRGVFTSQVLSDCDDELLTLTSFANNTTYDNANVIESSATMNKNNVTFKAESAVNLIEGFNVIAGKTFTAETDDCENH